tara:strand:+ start:42576 stop:43874 length:1299 start_codon:yes stop_codon:yes gene_type:complete
MEELRYLPKSFTEDFNNVLLVTVDSVEVTEENTFRIRFDGITNEWFQEFRNQELSEVYQKMESYHLLGEFGEDLNQWLSQVTDDPKYSSWFLLRLTAKKTQSPIEYFQDISELPEQVSSNIQSIQTIQNNADLSEGLGKFFNWDDFGSANLGDLENALVKPHSSKTNGYKAVYPHKLNVYNVGQGSMSAISDHNNVPLIYFDLGGGYYWHANTYPNTKQLCFTLANTIVLSHWHQDHFETIRRYTYNNWNRFNNKTWIIPKQQISSGYFKLLAQMASNGTVLVWDNSINEVRFWGGKIVKCTGVDKNHSGLALIVMSEGNSVSRILHPADAAYKYIPGIKKMKFNGLVATHHGANFPDGNSPIPRTSVEVGNIAYSHANKYGHPTQLSIDAHERMGWTNRRDTINGSISFSTVNDLRTPCGNGCDLSCQQYY